MEDDKMCQVFLNNKVFILKSMICLETLWLSSSHEILQPFSSHEILQPFIFSVALNSSHHIPKPSFPSASTSNDLPDLQTFQNFTSFFIDSKCFHSNSRFYREKGIDL